MKTIIEVKPELDDLAFALGDFVQKTQSLLDAEFEKFFVANKDKINGLTEEEKRDWLFDYIWNGWGKDLQGFELTFSETLAQCENFEIK